jgi:hypothetical protein
MFHTHLTPVVTHCRSSTYVHQQVEKKPINVPTLVFSTSLQLGATWSQAAGAHDSHYVTTSHWIYAAPGFDHPIDCRGIIDKANLIYHGSVHLYYFLLGLVYNSYET